MATETATIATRRPRNGVLRNISYLIGGQFTTWMLAALWTIVVPRLIGPAGMGQLVTVWSATGILAILVGLGTQIVVVTEIARDPAVAGRVTSAAIAARLLLLVPGFAIMALFLHFSNFGTYQVMLLVIGTISLPLTLVSDVVSSAMQGLERMQYIAYGSVIYRAITAAGGIIVVLLGYHVLGLVLLGFAAGAIGLACSLYWARSHFELHWRVSIGEIRRVAFSSLPYWATTVINTIYLWIDSVLLALLATATEVGWYGVPTKIFASLLFIPAIISTATLARLTATYGQGRETFTRTLTPIVEWTLVISFPLAAGIAAVAGPAINLFYGPMYAESAPVLSLLALAVPATYLNIVVNQSLVASGRQMVWTKVMAISVLLNVLLNVIAIPAAHAAWHNAALGAALSLLVTEALMAVVGLFFIRKSLDVAAVARVARAAGAALFMGVMVYAATPLGFAVQVLLGLAIVGLLAVPLRLVRPSELDVARGYAVRLQSRLARAR